jgi:hypothetical protein
VAEFDAIVNYVPKSYYRNKKILVDFFCLVNRSDHSVSHKRFTLSIPGAQKFPAQESPNFTTLAPDLN